MLTSFSTQEYYFIIEPIKITKVNGVSHFSLHDPPFFWSSNASGSCPMKEETRTLLGLPLPEVTMGGKRFTQDTYNAVSEYLKLKGFDPFSLDYARSQNYPIFKIFDDAPNQGPDEIDIFDGLPDLPVHPDPGSDSDSEDDIVYEYPSNKRILERKARLAPLESGTLGCRQMSQPHYHISECGSQKKQTRLRRTHSFSSFDRQKKITEPLLVRVCVGHHTGRSYGGYESYDTPELLRDVQQSQRIPAMHMDYFLDLVDF
ncbi:hypothetical protein BDP27DRAFT_1419138 [Rhodocollybia butyracea]|uniref:Uncharacterized protein n=1 Tax=Rhodocollybia butyracea TaxID=206335 RepID=A0A9P5PZY0_9AGAR|nr:hypothetical protein BDP27DRAFT_1419138 [Rhodocollybia butyracea]